jgi:hypothetical protein
VDQVALVHGFALDRADPVGIVAGRAGRVLLTTWHWSSVKLWSARIIDQRWRLSNTLHAEKAYFSILINLRARNGAFPMLYVI